MGGRSDMAFDPGDDITRAEMAVALVNLARHTAPHNFHQSGTSKGQLDIAASDLDHFSDARASVPVAVDTHISYLYELGITTGYDDATFRPNDGVPRRNMATFIMRALDHSNLRPAGLSVQSDSGTLTVSIRDADFAPVANETVDAFFVSSDKVERAFNDDDECRSIVASVDLGEECEIDSLDPATNADGNVQLESLEGKIGKGVTVWVWSGGSGDEVDDDTELVKFEQGSVVVPASARSTVVSPSQPKTPKARFGAAVQFEAQLQYTDARGLVKDTSVGEDGENYAQFSLVVHVYSGVLDRVVADRFSVAPATGAVTIQDTDGAPLGLVSTSAPETLKSDSDGKVKFTISTTDPNPSATSENDVRSLVYVLTPTKNAPDSERAADDTVTPAILSRDVARQFGYVIFSEASSTATTVLVSAINGYAEVPSSAGNPASNGVTVTVLDQYGRPMRGQGITLASSVNIDENNDGDFNDDDDVHNSVLPGERHTASTGSVRISYRHGGTTASVEVITATVTDGPTSVPPASIFWAERIAAAASVQPNPILSGSLSDDEIVVDTAPLLGVEPGLIRYDDNDVYFATLADGSSDYLDMEGFEGQLGAILDPDNQGLAVDAAGKLDGTLEWSSYENDDEDDRTLFTLVVTAVQLGN